MKAGTDTKYLTVIDGTTVRIDSVVAIRPLVALPEHSIKPRIIIDYVIGTSANCILLEYTSWKDTVAAASEFQKLVTGVCDETN